MKIQKIVLPLAVVAFMIWALMEQASEQPKLWVQIIGVALFFIAMARLMQKTPSNKPKESLVIRTDRQAIEEEQAEEMYSITDETKK
ncbi:MULTISPECIES: hypothetical protein [unclassified Myroides]|uniref:hypothetical protein n=1 Tax=unclassified Myroides TaxID=2642485 RepID=UPI0015F7A279|nr:MULTISPECIES: hypothetical protein [unclassified Myroides]MBB1150745.1 hypothetical protein [Myroides sp. NP-2]MDM1407578.1 hypothetical protein [Myroides sp. DF42-4-2]